MSTFPPHFESVGLQTSLSVVRADVNMQWSARTVDSGCNLTELHSGQFILCAQHLLPSRSRGTALCSGHQEHSITNMEICSQHLIEIGQVRVQ